jgi:hypothetical protein
VLQYEWTSRTRQSKRTVENIRETERVEADASGQALGKSGRRVGERHGLGFAHGDRVNRTCDGSARDGLVGEGRAEGAHRQGSVGEGKHGCVCNRWARPKGLRKIVRGDCCAVLETDEVGVPLSQLIRNCFLRYSLRELEVDLGRLGFAGTICVIFLSEKSQRGTTRRESAQLFC